MIRNLRVAYQLAFLVFLKNPAAKLMSAKRMSPDKVEELIAFYEQEALDIEFLDAFSEPPPSGHAAYQAQLMYHRMMVRELRRIQRKSAGRQARRQFEEGTFPSKSLLWLWCLSEKESEAQEGDLREMYAELAKTDPREAHRTVAKIARRIGVKSMLKLAGKWVVQILLGKLMGL